MILAVLARVGSAHAAEVGRYAPENIEQTYKQLRWLCVIAALCRSHRHQARHGGQAVR